MEPETGKKKKQVGVGEIKLNLKQVITPNHAKLIYSPENVLVDNCKVFYCIKLNRCILHTSYNCTKTLPINPKWWNWEENNLKVFIFAIVTNISDRDMTSDYAAYLFCMNI